MRLLYFLALVVAAECGCKNPREAGCSSCCRKVNDLCIQYSGGPTSFNRWHRINGPCPAGCTACSPCFDTELRLLKVAIVLWDPQCSCVNGTDANGHVFGNAADKCYSPSSCACQCTRFSQVGNQCRPFMNESIPEF